jgi:hypothetical protein
MSGRLGLRRHSQHIKLLNGQVCSKYTDIKNDGYHIIYNVLVDSTFCAMKAFNNPAQKSMFLITSTAIVAWRECC